jgi:hypothetical protein
MVRPFENRAFCPVLWCFCPVLFSFWMVKNKMAAKTIQKPYTKSVWKMTIRIPDGPVVHCILTAPIILSSSRNRSWPKLPCFCRSLRTPIWWPFWRTFQVRLIRELLLMTRMKTRAPVTQISPPEEPQCKRQDRVIQFQKRLAGYSHCNLSTVCIWIPH